MCELGRWSSAPGEEEENSVGARYKPRETIDQEDVPGMEPTLKKKKKTLQIQSELSVESLPLCLMLVGCSRVLDLVSLVHLAG